jgi:hypothetical protein
MQIEQVAKGPGSLSDYNHNPRLAWGSHAISRFGEFASPGDTLPHIIGTSSDVGPRIAPSPTEGSRSGKSAALEIAGDSWQEPVGRRNWEATRSREKRRHRSGREADSGRT